MHLVHIKVTIMAIFDFTCSSDEVMSKTGQSPIESNLLFPYPKIIRPINLDAVMLTRHTLNV